MSGKRWGMAAAVILLGTALWAETPTGVHLDLSLANPVVLAGSRQRTYLKISLMGYAPERARRPPANVAIVLDRSGSMSGEKIEQAKQAALVAVSMLDERDILSVVTYDDTVGVLVPATPVGDRRRLEWLIRGIEPGGRTALFAGVSRGAGEVRRYLNRERVNRVILLSDGLANVGPSTPGELGSLGSALREEGMAVTTIGLGLDYNEDLMVRLARASDGNHAFVEDPEDLGRIFAAELRDVLNVVARDVMLEIRCSGQVLPVRVLGRDADIVGQNVFLGMSQLYGNQEKYVLLEVDLPAGAPGLTSPVADVLVRYNDLVRPDPAQLDAQVAVAYTGSEQTVRERENRAALVEVVKQVATEQTEKAVQLRDEGRVEEAREVLQESAEYLNQNAARLAAPELEVFEQAADRAASNLDAESWNEERKQLRSEQYATQNQQSY